MNTFLELQHSNPLLQFIPITDREFPMVKEWEKTKAVQDFKNANGIGLVCGAISENV